jgi:hypothetical protein
LEQLKNICVIIYCQYPVLLFHPSANYRICIMPVLFHHYPLSICYEIGRLCDAFEQANQ